jgi:hypothetical protein
MVATASNLVDYPSLLKEQFGGRVRVQQKRPGIDQLFVPLYHEDGDMVDIFLQPSKSSAGKIRVCDYGLTVMRLSYSYEIDSDTKRGVFERILIENGIGDDDGNLFIDAEPENLYPAVMQFAQAVAKISSMRLWKRAVIHSLFFESLAETVESHFARFQPQPKVHPLDGQEEYEVDYVFNHRPRPIYLFGVHNSSNARLAIISIQHFQKHQMKFVPVVVLENVSVLPNSDMTRLLSAVDKPFPTLDDFRDKGPAYLDRELGNAA